MSYLGREEGFGDLLCAPADSKLVERLRTQPIRSVLDIGCHAGFDLLLCYYRLGSTWLEGVEKDHIEEEVLNRQRDGTNPDPNGGRVKLTLAECDKLLRVAYEDVHGYRFKKRRYDLIILGNVIHFWSEENARRTLGRIEKRIEPDRTRVYLRVKLGLDPNVIKLRSTPMRIGVLADRMAVRQVGSIVDRSCKCRSTAKPTERSSKDSAPVF